MRANVVSITDITVDEKCVAGAGRHGFTQRRCNQLALRFVLGADGHARTGFDKLLGATLPIPRLPPVMITTFSG